MDRGMAMDTSAKTGTGMSTGVGPKASASAPPLPPLRVRTLGAFAAWQGDEPLPAARWSRPVVAALFKLLLTTPGHRLAREQAIEQLWPHAGPDQGGAMLRKTLHRLRAVLDPPGTPPAASYVRSEGVLLTLTPAPGDARTGPEWLDAEAFARAAEAR